MSTTDTYLHPGDDLLDEMRNQACLATMSWAVEQLSPAFPGGAPHATGVAEHHDSVVRRWLEELEAAQRLDLTTGTWMRPPASRDQVRALWDEAERLAPENGHGGALTRYFALCAENLLDIVSGHVNVRALLFDNEDASAEIYQNNPASTHANTFAAAQVREHCAALAAQGHTATVLEIGGGVGGTTDPVMDALVDLPVRYHFTDVSPWFSRRAHQRWAGRSGLTTGHYDINADPASRRTALTGLDGRIDVILAANVMHNAVDIPACLQFLADVSAPGARLVLIETGTEHLPLLISMRFLMTPPPPSDGIGGDRAHRGRILLESSEWTRAVRQSPWQLRDVSPGPDPNHPLAHYDQHVWTAELPPGG